MLDALESVREVCCELPQGCLEILNCWVISPVPRDRVWASTKAFNQETKKNHQESHWPNTLLPLTYIALSVFDSKPYYSCSLSWVLIIALCQQDVKASLCIMLPSQLQRSVGESELSRMGWEVAGPCAVPSSCCSSLTLPLLPSPTWGSKLSGHIPNQWEQEWLTLLCFWNICVHLWDDISNTTCLWKSEENLGCWFLTSTLFRSVLLAAAYTGSAGPRPSGYSHLYRS